MSQEKDSRQYIKIRGANEHNLKNIDVDIPRNKMVVLTGLSGSGKSSLAFDTIYGGLVVGFIIVILLIIMNDRLEVFARNRYGPYEED